jgi:hypothetical protein
VPREEAGIACVGSFALVSLWQISGRVDFLTPTLGRWAGEIRGNDAVVVTRELRSRGLDACCCLLDPTDEDFAAVGREFGAEAVGRVGGRAGGYTRSVCIESSQGERSWIFSRVPQPVGTLPSFKADVVYVDYYREFTGFFDHQWLEATARTSRLFVNLSGIHRLEDVLPFPVKPHVLQASMMVQMPPDDVRLLAAELQRATGAETVVVTMGSRGAVLASNAGTWYVALTAPRAAAILGAGAIFSAEAIVGVSAGLNHAELLERTVHATACRLFALECDESYSA